MSSWTTRYLSIWFTFDAFYKFNGEENDRNNVNEVID